MRTITFFVFFILYNLSVLAQEPEYPEDVYYSYQFGNPALTGAGNIVAYGNDMLYLARDIGQTYMFVYDKNNNQKPYGLAKWDGKGWILESPGYLNVNDLIIYGSNLIAAGSFTSINNQPFNYIASWDGSSWLELDGGTNGEIYTLATDGVTLFAGGSFSRVGDTLGSHVALFDGIHWYPMYDEGELAQGTNGEVLDLEASSTDIYTAGGFGTAGGRNVSNIASWTRNPRWNNLSSGTNNKVRAVTWSAFGPVIGGDFTTAGGATVNGVAMFNGTDWQPMGNGANGQVLELTTVSGEAVGYGRFLSPYEYTIARFRNDQWEELGNQTKTITVNNMVSDGQYIWAGTHSSYTKGAYLGGLAYWDTQRWRTLSNALGGYWNANEAVNALQLWNDGSIIAAGNFSLAGGDSIAAICRWNGEMWDDMGAPFAGLSYAAVNTMQMYMNKLYVAGNFTDIAGSGSSNIGAWDGITWSGVAGGVSGEIFALEVFDNQLYAGGDIWQVNGVSQYKIARWDGAQWLGFDNPPSGPVYSFLNSGGMLYVGGLFTVYQNNASFTGIAAWDGSVWHDVGGGVGGVTYPTVRAIAEGTDGIYIGGTFSTVGSNAANNIARWDGAQWHTLGDGLDGDVYVIYTNGNDVYAGGNFTTADGDTVWSFARWDGAQWHRMGNGMHLDLNYPANATVKALLGTEQGLWIGGNFSQAGVYLSNKIAFYSDFKLVTALDENTPKALPENFRLFPAYPNPFNPYTTIAYALPHAAHVRISVYDISGRKIRELLDEVQPAGRHNTRWQGLNHLGQKVPSGLYFVRMQADNFEQSSKIVLLK